MGQVRKERGKHGTIHVALIRKANAFPEPPVAFLCSGLGHVTTPSGEGKDFQSLGGRIWWGPGEEVN